MSINRRASFPGVLCALVVVAWTLEPAPASVLASRTGAQAAAKEPERQRDFDWEIGTWRTRLSRLVRPLSGSRAWVYYEGTSVVRKVWNGRANLVELNVAGPAGRIEGLSLRLYNPESGKWTMHYSSSRDGLLSPPVTGWFANGRGEFSGPDTLNGRPILVRFIISNITANSCRFEQAFSADDGKTWEVNWIALDTRMRDAPIGPSGDRGI